MYSKLLQIGLSVWILTLVVGCGTSNYANNRSLLAGNNHFAVVDELIVTDQTNDFPIPGNNKCKIKVTLKSVVYLGQDIGRTWQYAIKMGEVEWRSDIRTLAPGSIDYIDQVVINEEFISRCPNYKLIVFEIEGRELDWFMDDIGQQVFFKFVQCMEKKRVEKSVVSVPVFERPVWCKIKNAFMVFIFEIESQCVTE